MNITEIKVDDLSQAKVDGEGVFDVLMRSTKAHLDQEFRLNRITGPEYSTVYLGSLQQVMQTSLEFLLQKNRIGLEAELLKQQILLAQKELEKADKELELADKQIELAELNVKIQEQMLLKVPAEIALLEAQAQLTIQQTVNAETENTVLKAQKCKLDAEFDLISQNVLKVGAEMTLLSQKTLTERAQITSMGVDEDSVIGRQKRLYHAQTEGFKRDAEQKAAKILIDAWGIQRSTDEGIQANDQNMLYDPSVGRVVNKLITGVEG